MMSGIRGRDTRPELVLRKGLFQRGLRFRLHSASLPGRPDLVIRKYRAVILVHGCFWHAHLGCRYFRVPDSNRVFWEYKLDMNRKRDVRNVAALQAAGWRVAVVWECATRADPSAAIDSVLRFLEQDSPYLEVFDSVAQSAVRSLEGPG